MMYASFETLAQAKAWAALHGGRIFHADSGEAVWFNPRFTATPIMLHPATRGKSGVLV